MNLPQFNGYINSATMSLEEYLDDQKTFTLEFKLESVRQMEESDRPASEIARELGIRRNQLYKWREQLLNEKTWSAPVIQGVFRVLLKMSFIPLNSSLN